MVAVQDRVFGKAFHVVNSNVGDTDDLTGVLPSTDDYSFSTVSVIPHWFNGPSSSRVVGAYVDGTPHRRTEGVRVAKFRFLSKSRVLSRLLTLNSPKGDFPVHML